VERGQRRQVRRREGGGRRQKYSPDATDEVVTPLIRSPGSAREMSEFPESPRGRAGIA